MAYPESTDEEEEEDEYSSRSDDTEAIFADERYNYVYGSMVND